METSLIKETEVKNLISILNENSVETLSQIPDPDLGAVLNQLTIMHKKIATDKGEEEAAKEVNRVIEEGLLDTIASAMKGVKAGVQAGLGKAKEIYKDASKKAAVDNYMKGLVNALNQTLKPSFTKLFQQLANTHAGLVKLSGGDAVAAAPLLKQVIDGALKTTKLSVAGPMIDTIVSQQGLITAKPQTATPEAGASGTSAATAKTAETPSLETAKKQVQNALSKFRNKISPDQGVFLSNEVEACKNIDCVKTAAELAREEINKATTVKKPAAKKPTTATKQQPFQDAGLADVAKPQGKVNLVKEAILTDIPSTLEEDDQVPFDEHEQWLARVDGE